MHFRSFVLLAFNARKIVISFIGWVCVTYFIKSKKKKQQKNAQQIGHQNIVICHFIVFFFASALKKTIIHNAVICDTLEWSDLFELTTKSIAARFFLKDFDALNPNLQSDLQKKRSSSYHDYQFVLKLRLGVSLKQNTCYRKSCCKQSRENERTNYSAVKISQFE